MAWRVVGLAGVAASGFGVAAAEPERGMWFIAFASADVETASSFATSGGKLVVDTGLDGYSGFLQVTSGISLSDAIHARNGKWSANKFIGRYTVGLEKSFGALFVSAGAGLSYVREDFNLGWIYGRLTYLGLVLHGDAWYRPDAQSYYAVSSVLDFADRTVWSRLRYGQTFANWPFAIGPEASWSFSPGYYKVKLGAHLSEFKLWRLNFDLSGGLQIENRGPGGYLGLTMWTKY